jgi:hypothetical protein
MVDLTKNDIHFQVYHSSSCSLWVLNKGSTVWLDGARRANICIPPTFSGNVPMHLLGIPTPKSTFLVYVNLNQRISQQYMHSRINSSPLLSFSLLFSFCNFLPVSAVAGFEPLYLGSLVSCSTNCDTFACQPDQWPVL